MNTSQATTEGTEEAQTASRSRRRQENRSPKTGRHGALEPQSQANKAPSKKWVYPFGHQLSASILESEVRWQALVLGRSPDADVTELRRTILRYAGDKKGYLHLVRPGDYEAIISLPDGVGVAHSLELAHALRGRFGYDVLRLH